MKNNRVDLPKEISYKAEFINALQNEFINRCRKNSSYSLRAFAQFLEISPSALSRILRGQRTPKDSTMIRLSDRLGIKINIGVNSNISTERILEDDIFSLITDWYHFAILELTRIEGFRLDSRFVASKLDISVIEAKQAIDRLKRIGLLIIDNDKVSAGFFTNSNSNNRVTNADKIKLQKQYLEKASHALEVIPMNKRSQFGMSFALNNKELDEYKKIIKKFTEKISRKAYQEGEQNSVYQLSVSLFPLTKVIND